MDFLVKQNIIKKNKVIVDIGRKYTKLLMVTYEKGHIGILDSQKVDTSSCFTDGELMDVRGLVQKITTAVGKKKLSKKTELSVSIPSSMVIYKIVPVKNVSTKDLKRYVKREFITLGKINTQNYETDWAYLGSREENGETVHYCMLAGVNKAYIMPILTEFEKRSYRVTQISFSVADLISLCDLYSEDYEHPNKMLLDFGITSTRVIIECEGVVVYTREIPMGFTVFVESLFHAFGTLGYPEIVAMLTEMGLRRDNFLAGIHDKDAFFDVIDKLAEDFQNELIRMMQMCEESGYTITKIISTGRLPEGLMDVFSENGIAVEKMELQEKGTKKGSSYIVTAEPELEPEYGVAVGLAVNTLL